MYAARKGEWDEVEGIRIFTNRYVERGIRESWPSSGRSWVSNSVSTESEKRIFGTAVCFLRHKALVFSKEC